MSLTANDFNNMLKSYISTTEGKQYVKNSVKAAIKGGTGAASLGVLTEAEMELIAEDLKEIIYNEIILAGIKSYKKEDIIVQSPHESPTGDFIVNLEFPSEALARKSLWSGSKNFGGFTGNGLYDVIGLFVNGYHARKKVYGFWLGHETGGKIPSLTVREANDFIARAVALFIAQHAGKGISVKFPKEWGGTL